MIEKFIEIAMDLIENDNVNAICEAIECFDQNDRTCKDCPLGEDNIDAFLSNLNNYSERFKCIYLKK